VTGPCDALLDSDDAQFIQRFNALTKPQQCLVVRFINRKSIFVKATSYAYEEIENISGNLNYLKKEYWFTTLESKNIPAFIEHLTKDEIIQIIDEINTSYASDTQTLVYKKSQAKAILVDVVLSGTKLNLICKTKVASAYWQGNFEAHISYFLYVYFGNFQSKLNQFSMRDLGVMRTRKEQAQVMARFADIGSAKSAFEIHSLLDEIHAQLPLLKRDAILKHLDDLPSPIGARAKDLNEELQFLLACELLKEDANQACLVLKTINTDTAQEKWVREGYKLGLKDEVEAQLECIIEVPLSEDLLAFAEDFLARKYHKKRTSILTDMLRKNSQTILIDEMHKGAVERGVVAYYESQGCAAMRTENEIWRALFLA
jgi:DNA polymerase-3 subunit epsilon